MGEIVGAHRSRHAGTAKLQGENVDQLAIGNGTQLLASSIQEGGQPNRRVVRSQQTRPRRTSIAEWHARHARTGEGTDSGSTVRSPVRGQYVVVSNTTSIVRISPLPCPSLDQLGLVLK